MSDVVDAKSRVADRASESDLPDKPNEQTLQFLANAVRRNLRVDQLLGASGGSASLDIAKIELSDSGADHVQISQLTTRVECGSAVLKDVRAIIELKFTAHWSYDLKWLGSDSGIKELGQKANTVSLHDIELPMLEDFVFEVPEVEVRDVEVSIDPLQDLQLGGSELEGLRASRTDAPAQGFTLSDLDLGQLRINGVEIPATLTESVEIDAFKPREPLNLPSLSLGPIAIPAIDIDDVQSRGAVSVMGAELESISAPVFKLGDLFRIKLVVDPILHLQIGNVVLSDLKASADIESVELRDIESRVAVSGVSMQDLALEEIAVNRAEIA